MNLNHQQNEQNGIRPINPIQLQGPIALGPKSTRCMVSPLPILSDDMHSTRLGVVSGHFDTPNESMVLSQESNQRSRSRSPPRCPPRCRPQDGQSSQSQEQRNKTGFDSHPSEWKVPFVGQDPKTGKVYFIDTSLDAPNMNSTILRNRHLWYQCPFNIHHTIKTSKKFVTHLKRCYYLSQQGYNGRRSKKESQDWILCEFNFHHKVHKDYIHTHYRDNCPQMIMDVSLKWNKKETAV